MTKVKGFWTFLRPGIFYFCNLNIKSNSMKHLLISVSIFFSAISLVSAQQSLWLEYQNNYQFFNKDSAGFTTHTLDLFYSGKEIKHGFSMTAFALITKDWAEVLALPTWTKQTKKAGLFSFSLGAGLETFTAKPRLCGSIFWTKKRLEGLFLWEQGTNDLSNNWHLAYLTYKIAQHQEGTYATVGLHSQRLALHGLKATIGCTNDFEVWIVLGKPSLKEKSSGALIGIRKFL